MIVVPIGTARSPEEVKEMNKWIKTGVTILVVAFAVYYLYTRPEAAAEFVKGAFGIFDSLGRFFATLAKE
jgi:hypothetical protein